MIGVGVGVGLVPPLPSSGAPPANPNLLTWTDDFSNGAWVGTSLQVNVDQAAIPATGQQADELVSLGLNASARQTSTTVATGSAVTLAIAFLSAGFNRYQVTGTFSSGTYTFSVYAQDAGAGAAYVLRLDSAGGFLRCSIENALGDGDALWGSAQLELGASATTYQARTT